MAAAASGQERELAEPQVNVRADARAREKDAVLTLSCRAPRVQWSARFVEVYGHVDMHGYISPASPA